MHLLGAIHFCHPAVVRGKHTATRLTSLPDNHPLSTLRRDDWMRKKYLACLLEIWYNQTAEPLVALPVHLENILPNT
jgi:hypothetical protein